MQSKQLMFFAIFSDIEEILKSIEGVYDIHYFEMGLFDHQNIQHYNSIFDVPRLGYTEHGDWNYDRQLLVMPKSLFLNIRSVPQKKGGIKYAVDPVNNPISICLQLGGVYKRKDAVLIAGKAGTVSDSKFSEEIFKTIASKIKKQFKKIQEFYVSKLAEEKLHLNWRLVLDERRKQEYDLKIN